MSEVSIGKRMEVVTLYFEGRPYEEIARVAGVSKGTVVNVVKELRTGQFADLVGPKERIDALREVALALRRDGVTPAQAASGLSVIKGFQVLGIDPVELEHAVTFCRELAPELMEPSQFVRAAQSVWEVQKRTGMSATELEAWVRELEDQAASLEASACQAREIQQDIDEMRECKAKLVDEMEVLKGRIAALKKEIGSVQRREDGLGKQVEELETRKHQASMALAAARRAMEQLATLGLAPDGFPGLASRLAAIAQRHDWKAGELQDRLMDELDALDAGFSLERKVAAARDALDGLKSEVQQLRTERDRLQARISRLRKEERRMDGELQMLIENINPRIEKMCDAVALAMARAAARIQDRLDATGDIVVKLTSKMARLDALIQSREWLKTLLTLVEGSAELEPTQVKTLGLIVLRGLHAWMKGKPDLRPPLVVYELESLIPRLEAWNP